MKNQCLIAVTLLYASSSAIAKWDAKLIPKTSKAIGDRFVLIYHPDADRGTKTIGDAVDKLAKAGHIAALQTLTVHDLVQDETFQQEVIEQLEKNAPQAFGAAKRSAGNMHNPTMVALHADFERAVMTTPTVTTLAKALASHGMKISRPSFEKLELKKKDQGIKFKCALWLSVEPAVSISEGQTIKP